MERHHKPPIPTSSRDSARRLRAKSTDAESKLWYRLRAGRLNGLKFRRQHPLPPYVVDFCCEAARLVVEADGSQHDETIDAVRDAALQRQGYRVLRFWDNEVLTNIEEVLQAAGVPNVVPIVPDLRAARAVFTA